MASVRNVQGYTLDAISILAPLPIVANRAPTVNDINYPLGIVWVYPVGQSAWILTGVANNAAVWVDVAGASGVFSSLTVNPGPTNLSTVGNGAVTIGNTSNTGAISIVPGSGNFSLAGAAGATIGIGAAAQTGKISIGDSTGALTADLLNGVAAGAQVLDIGSGTPAANVTINILNSVATAGTQTFNVLGSAATRAGAVNIGTGAAAHQIAIGSSTAGNLTTLASPITALPGPVYVYTGAGAPSNGLALHVGDLYINTTAASDTTRLYIATAASTWTNVTCAA